MMAGSYRALLIGYLGADWWGSDARAMGVSLRQQGHLLVERHYEDYLTTRWQGVVSKALRRLALPIARREYNRAVGELLTIQALDCLIVFKGMLLAPQTLEAFRQRGVACYLVYPDVSFHDHGGNIWPCLPYYNCVFTTKSFHLEDAALTARCRDLRLIHHGFDPEVHRPVNLGHKLSTAYGCDVSFVGCWSPKKETLIETIVNGLPEVKVSLWGPNWHRAGSVARACWLGRGAYGDELAAIYSCSKINLGLLSEAGTGVASGDLTTARSFQIPAAGGFMLHEDNAEIRGLFEAGREVATFDGAEDLVVRVRELLDNDARREEMRAAGHARCMAAAYTYVSAAQQIADYHRKHEATGVVPV